MVAGTHGSTFGGNPLAVAAGNAVLDVMLEPGFFDARRADGASCCAAGSKRWSRAYPKLFAEVRGSGLLLGIRCVVHGRRFRGEAARRAACCA